MKKLLIVLATCLIAALSLSFAIAQDRNTPMMQKNMPAGNNWNKANNTMGSGEMGAAHSSCGMMMSSIMSHTMVSSGDGGVIVMMGDKLQKYDKNLMLVKEVQVAYDIDHMSQMMSEVQKMCYATQSTMPQGMMQGSMQGGMMQGYQPDPK